jgi:hypothetical protein
MSTQSAPPASGNKKLIITLAAVSGVLLLALVAVVFLMIGQGLGSQNPPNPGAEGSPSATLNGSPSETPSAEPGSSPTASTPPPADTKTKFTSFKAPTTVRCDAGNEDNQPPKPPITVSWTSANAVEAWYSPGNQDAKNKNYMQVPLNGNQNDFTDEHLFPCFDQGPSRDYTITLVGPHGEHVSKTWTVTDLSR